MDGSLFLVIRVDAARGPSSPSLDRIAFGPLPGADCRISDWQRLSQEVSQRVGQQTEGWVLFTSRGPDHLCYDECIGAKKHLVTSPPTGPPRAQSHSLLQNTYNGGSDRQVMVLPYR